MSSPSEGDATLRRRVRQQEAVAGLGQRALEADGLEELMGEVVATLAETLEVEYAAVLERRPGCDDFLLRQGVGWSDDLVGSAAVSADRDSQAGYTLRSEDPVIVDDLRDEDRFADSGLLDRDVVCGMSVVVGSAEEPWGVLGVHATTQREFADHDATFVQSVANVLAAAVESRRSHHELERVHGRISDAFFALDEDWTFTYLNDRAHDLINEENRELIGENVWEAFPDASDRKYKPTYERAMYQQESVTFEEYYPEPLDSWFEIRAYPSESGLSVYFQDVTERKTREKELELFRSLVDRSTDGMFVIDPETGRFVDVNDTACRSLGYSRDELLGLRVPEVEREFDDLESWREFIDELRTEGQRIVDGVHRRADGSTFPVEANVSYVELNREYVFAIVRDVTELRRRERRLEATERRYRTLAENFPNGVVALFDEDLRYTTGGGQLMDELEVDREAAAGQSIHDRYPADLVETVEPHFRAALEGESNSFEVSYRGRDLWAHTLPVTTTGPSRRGMLVAQDVTERKEYQRKLEQSNERLEQFAYAASHDLQEPLRMVSSYVQLIEDRYADDLDEDGREFLAFAVDGADRMRSMIDGLLEYSRVETRGDPFETVDLDDVVDDVLEDLQLRIDESDAEIATESLPPVEGDAGQLRQVFQNLLSNAIEYSGDEPPRIHVGAAYAGSRWTVSVSDEGIGIDPDDQDRVFEVFQRLEGNEEAAGTGIGLALCRRIVERHGGEIQVDSEPGEGATFWFTLPAADDA